MPIATIDPATGRLVKSFDAYSAQEVDKRLADAWAAFESWRPATFGQRAAVLDAVADALERDRDAAAETMTTEMGKTITASRAEVDKCVKAFRFYARHGERLLADEPADAAAVGATRAFVRYRPLGPVLAVMPWNFPLWQVVRFAAPALMAGNVGLLKHASNVPQTALLIEDLFRRAGAPDAVFQTLLVSSDAVDAILRDPRVRAASVTGSAGAGAAVASAAGTETKKTVLELGGSDPFVVLPSADLDEAARVGVVARCQNNGQSCIAAKRFIVHEEVADAFRDRFVERMSSLRIGDPADESTELGPLATEQGRALVEEQVADAVRQGAVVLCGGEALEGPGWYYPPTVIGGVTPEMRIFHEEVFGPVAQLYRARDADEALRISNATPFGLGSNVWTRDAGEQEWFVDGLEAGMVFVNGMTTSYPEIPFGGVERSGYGRELGALGIREFCNAKTVWVGEGATGSSLDRSE
jgi:succinate-semialdehyde dehydrogenase/glutarate-semialdehyde dehydrogenase